MHSCVTPTTIKTISIIPKSSLMPFCRQSHSSRSSPTPGNHLSVFSTMVLPFFTILYVWEHIIHCLLRMVYFTLLNAFEIHPCINSLFLFIAELYSTILIYSNLFTHSPVDRHLGCQFGAVTDTASMRFVYKSWLNIHFYFLLAKYLDM